MFYFVNRMEKVVGILPWRFEKRKEVIILTETITITYGSLYEVKYDDVTQSPGSHQSPTPDRYGLSVSHTNHPTSKLVLLYSNCKPLLYSRTS